MFLRNAYWTVRLYGVLRSVLPLKGTLFTVSSELPWTDGGDVRATAFEIPTDAGEENCKRHRSTAPRDLV